MKEKTRTPFRGRGGLLIVLLALGIIIPLLIVREAQAACVDCKLSLDVNSISTTDNAAASSFSHAKTFRAGAVVTNVDATNFIEVFAWQFAISYDPNALIPQADPLADNLGSDESADLTVKYGTTSLPGTTPASASWAALLSVGGASAVVDIDHRPADGFGKITIAYTILAPNTARRISSPNLLANVAFELVSKPASPVTMSLSDLIFLDGTGASIPVTAGAEGTVTIANEPPQASFTVSNSNPNPDVSISFDGSGSTDSDGTITTYVWDFGDGTINTTGATVTHAYPTSGPYDVTLRVIDNLEATGSAKDSLGSVLVNNQPSHKSQMITVNTPPTASFTFTPQPPLPTLPVTFDGSSSQDPDGTITNYRWNFGDETPEDTTSGAIVDHTYSREGTYQVTLTVTDNGGLTHTIPQNVLVAQATYDIALTRIDAPTGTRVIGEILQVQVDVSNQGNVRVNATITLTTGTTTLGSQEVTNLGPLLSITTSFTWETTTATPGTQTILVTATLSGGVTDANPADNTISGGSLNLILTTVYINPGIIDPIQPGQTFTVNITAAAVGVAAWQVKISYNHNVLSVKALDVKLGPYWKSLLDQGRAFRTPLLVDSEKGTITTAFTLLGSENAFTGTGPLLTIPFTVVSSESSRIHIVSVDEDPNGTQLLDNAQGGKSFLPSDGFYNPIENIAVKSVSATSSIATIGNTIDVTVTIDNEGVETETFTVRLYANNRLIGEKTITLTFGNTTSIVFHWDTTGQTAGDYALRSCADQIPDESDTEDNCVSGGTLRLIFQTNFFTSPLFLGGTVGAIAAGAAGYFIMRRRRAEGPVEEEPVSALG